MRVFGISIVTLAVVAAAYYAGRKGFLSNVIPT